MADTFDVPLSDPVLGAELRLLAEFMVAANRCCGTRMPAAQVDAILLEGGVRGLAGGDEGPPSRP